MSRATRPPRRGVRHALTVLQPWAWAICYAGKRLENRGWAPRWQVLRRGEWFAVHAAIRLDCPPNTLLGPPYFCEDVPEEGELVRGAIVALAKYGGTLKGRPWREDPQARWYVGPKAWELTEVLVLPKPVECRGGRSLWQMPPEVRGPVMDQFREIAPAAAAYQVAAQ